MKPKYSRCFCRSFRRSLSNIQLSSFCLGERGIFLCSCSSFHQIVDKAFVSWIYETLIIVDFSTEIRVENGINGR
ncbi:hypothetical protein SDJN03_22261, partial [Cucurbita argyrosperma subsp. sororia]